jgi:hypothetical protein
MRYGCAGERADERTSLGPFRSKQELRRSKQELARSIQRELVLVRSMRQELARSKREPNRSSRGDERAACRASRAAGHRVGRKDRTQELAHSKPELARSS